MQKKDVNESRFVLGQRFRVVKNGLDENEVMPFVAALIEQNNEYAKKLQHVDGLTKLAENAIIEAGAIAKALRIEITEKAREEAAAITADADVEAKRVLADAQRKAEQMLAEAENLAQENLKRAEAEAEEISAAARSEAIAIVADATRNAEEVAGRITAAAADQRRSLMETLLRGMHELRAEAEGETLASAQEAEELLRRAVKLAHEMRERIGRVFEEVIETLSLDTVAPAGEDSPLGESEVTGQEQKEPKPSRGRGPHA